MERLHRLVGIGLAAAAIGRASPAPAQDLSAVEASLQSVLDSVVASGSTPGITMRIDAPALGLSWSGASGVADIETGTPLSPGNPVRIASNTKTFVAASTLRLWEDGRLGLDDPVSKHLPAAYIEMLEADGYDLEAMTVRHLLTHTSGVYDYADRERYVEAILADPTHRWTPEEQVALAMEWGNPYGPPGEIYRYSDTGYVLLAQIVESVNGRPLAASMRELLALDSLGLRSTWMETLEDPPPGA
ncbi:MAG: serine hydrolase domain-containing protein, partial [Candidatus Palauibacterales bacterium]|nr:serine hydrolase domain-containing protein [Candidatus Palauibacterales bacterium]